MSTTKKIVALQTERDQLYAELRRVQAENQRLRGLQPEFPPRPPEGSGLPRYGLRWNGPQLPLAVPMDDGYWTPWHLAAQLHAELEAIRGQQPVGELILFAGDSDLKEVSWVKGKMPDVGTKLYAFPPQQPDAVSVPRELLERVVGILGSQGFSAWDELAAEVLGSTKNAEEGE